MSATLNALLAAALCAAAGPAAAQTTSQPPAATNTPAGAQPASATAATQPEPKPRLILELDDASQRQIMFGSGAQANESGPRDAGLPSLGGDARALPPPGTSSRTSPYPKESGSAVSTPY